MINYGHFNSLACQLLACATHTAREIILTGEVPVNRLSPRDLQPQFKNQLLDCLVAPNPPANHGAPPIAADYATHMAVATYLKELNLTDVHLVGEEAPKDAWNAALSASTGTVLALDAVDGSKPFDDLTFGYGSTIVALDKVHAEGYTLRGSAISNSTGIFVSIEFDNKSEPVEPVFGWIDDPIEMDDHLAPLVVYEDNFNDSISIVASRPEARKVGQRLMSAPELEHRTIYNLGGAPAAVGLFRGRLGMLLCVERQTMWDSAHLPIAASIGMPIYRLDEGRSCNLKEVLSWFTTLSIDPIQGKPVPPYLIARTDDYAELLLNYVRNDDVLTRLISEQASGKERSAEAR